MWRDVILSISTVDDSTVESLRIRKITAVKIRECKCVALENSPEEDFIETMVLGSKALLYLRQRDQLVGLPRFEKLSCLIAHLDCKADLWESFRVESSLVRLIRYLSNLKQLYINHCCHPSQLSSDTFHSIRDILPKLTDFEYSGVNTDHIYMISIPITSSMDQVPYVRGACFKSLERLAGVSLDLRADNEIDWLSEFFPNVRHLELGVSDFDLGDLVMRRAELDSHTLMNIRSVTLAISPGWWKGSQMFLSYLPKIEALKLVHLPSHSILSNKYFIDYDERDSDDIIQLTTACPQLTVLNLLGNKKYSNLPEAAILVVTSVMTSLQILVLPQGRTSQCAYTPEFAETILSRLPKLKSLLGIKVDNTCDDKHVLEYKSDPTNLSQVMRRYNSFWKRVTTGSAQWFEAHGISYFYPQSSIPNIHLTEKERQRFQSF